MDRDTKVGFFYTDDEGRTRFVGGPGSGGGGSGASSRDVAKVVGKASGTGDEFEFSVGKSVDDDVFGKEGLIIVFQDGTTATYIGGNYENIHHADMASALGKTGTEYDKAVRAYAEFNKLMVPSVHVGGWDASDVTKFRMLETAAVRLMNSGYAEQTPLTLMNLGKPDITNPLIFWSGGKKEMNTNSEKIRNWLIDDKINRDWLKLLLRLRLLGEKAGSFITNEEGRVIFIGGPGQGGGSSGASTVGDMAQQLRADAEKVEPELTSFITDFVEENDGQLEGLDFRLKTVESIESKIQRDAIEDGISHGEAAQGLTDLVRYTAIFPGDQLTDKASGMQEQLAEQGWQRYDHKWRNYFGPGGVYRGYNTVYINEDGQRFELQFHTPESLAIKHQVHQLYTIARELPKGAERTLLNQQMQALWSGFENPASYQNLVGEVMNP